jgi:hypothetical protein
VLTLFKKLYHQHRREEIENCIAKAAEFIGNKQASDGSWFVSHCFLINAFSLEYNSSRQLLFLSLIFVSMPQISPISRSYFMELL